MKVRITIPESYADITIAQYKEMMERWKKGERNKNTISDVLEVLCGADAELVERMHVEDIAKLTKDLYWLFQEPQIHNFPLKQTFHMQGKEYGFIPNMQELTVGEFADLETYLEQGMYENLQEVMAVLYRAVTEKKAQLYEIETYSPSKIKIDAMGECPMDVAIGAVVFFYRIETLLANALGHYSPVAGSKTR
jgi:hypothetical protein